VVSYDLQELRKNPKAPPPESKIALGPKLLIRAGGKLRKIAALGPSALAVRDGYLYVGYRTTSVILRFPLRKDGSLQNSKNGELIAVFEPFDPKTQRSANLIDMAFNPNGELFVSCSKEGRIWNIGKPDPSQVFQGNDQSPGRPTSAAPFADLRVLLGKKTACGNILFDKDGRLFLCAGNYDTPSRKLAGVIYRVDPR
jgi:WD40 repeat protein